MRKRNRVAAAVAMLAVGGAVALSGSVAVADTVEEAYTWGEFNDTYAGQGQGNVQGPNGCDCHGYKTRSWVGQDGHQRFEMVYADGEASSVFLTYRWDSFGTARVTQRMFATDGEGYVVPFS